MLPITFPPQIRSLSPLSSLVAPGLQELYCAQNKIGAISHLSHLSTLTTLELGSNRIRQVEGLEGQGALQELWLGRNRIMEIQNMDHLTNLKRISLQSNRSEQGHEGY